MVRIDHVVGAFRGPVHVGGLILFGEQDRLEVLRIASRVYRIIKVILDYKRVDINIRMPVKSPAAEQKLHISTPLKVVKVYC